MCAPLTSLLSCSITHLLKLHCTLGWILIDRCGKHFPLILNFLRDGTVPLPQNEVELQEVLIEAKYYLIEQLVDLCEKALEKKKEEHDPICRVPLITSAKEERQLVTGKKVYEEFIVFDMVSVSRCELPKSYCFILP